MSGPSSSSAMAPPPVPLQTPRRPPATSAATPFKTPLRTPGEQTSHTPVVDFDLIEYQKENVQPSSRGRSAHSLSHTLGLKHKERAEELSLKRAEWEAKVLPEKLEENDDPLIVWEDYVDWVTESYPSGGTSVDSGLVPLLERATRSLKDDERYRDSYRYLRLWLMYSRNVESAELVLNWLLANDVGTKCAALYEEAASLAESKRLYESADSLYRLGISRSATPLPRLKRRYEEYKTRILRNQSAPGSSSDIETTNGLSYTQALERAMRESRRVMLGTKDDKTGRSLSANAIRGNGQSAGLPLGSKVGGLANNGRKLGIFKDADGSRAENAGRGPEMADLGSRDARRQENVKEAKPWKGERLPQKMTSAPLNAGKAPIKIFQDSDEEDEHPTRTPKKDSSVFTSKPTLGSQYPEVDNLKRNPFSLWNKEVQKAAEALREVELGDVAKLGVRDERDKRTPHTSSKSALTVTSTSNGSSGKEKKLLKTSKTSSSRGTAPESAVGSSTKRPERLAVPEKLLYPEMVPASDCSGTSTMGSLERSMDEVRALQLRWPLNISGNEEEDPWAYLDPPLIQTPDMEEDVEDEASLPIEGSSTPRQSSPARRQESPSSSPQQRSFSTDQPSRRNPNMTLIGAREPTVTAFTREANRAALELINGPGSDDDEDSDSEEPDSEDEEDEEEYVPRGGVPPTPTPLQRNISVGSAGAASLSGFSNGAPTRMATNENAMVQATPLRTAPSVSRGFAANSRGGLGGGASSLVAATPLRKPLGGGLGLAAKKNIFVEEDEDEADDKHHLATLRGGPQRILPSLAGATAEEDEEEESESEEDRRAYNFTEGQDLLQGGARYDQLTTISERTEYETRWGMTTPGKGRVLSIANEEDGEEDEQHLQQNQAKRMLPANGVDERSFTSEESSQDQASRSQFGGQAQFQLSPGYTIEKGDDGTNCHPQPESSASQISANHSSPTALVTTAPNPCSPTDPEVIDMVLTALALPIESSPDYRDCTSRTAHQLANLKKRAKAQLRKSVGNSSFAGSSDWTIEVDSVVFAIREMLGEGAYGSVFLAEDVENKIPSGSRSKHGLTLGGIAADSSFVREDQEDEQEDEEEDEDEAERRRMVAIKVESPPNRWEFYVLGQLRARLEARALQSIISARRFYAFQDESYLVLEWGEKGTLLELVNQASSAGVAPTSLGGGGGGGASPGGVEEILAMFFTIELLRLIESLHKAKLLHGDLKVDNVLLRLEDPPSGVTWSNTYARDGSNGWNSKGIHLLDFGRAIDLSVFPANQGFIADWETDGRECLEMREGRPWTYQADYFGVASVAYCLLFGKYIETTSFVDPTSSSTTMLGGAAGFSGGGGGMKKSKIVGSYKRWWQVDLWTRLFDVLLNPRMTALALGKARGEMPITDEVAAVRREMEDWLEANCAKGGKNLKGLLKKLEIWSMKRRP